MGTDLIPYESAAARCECGALLRWLPYLCAYAGHVCPRYAYEREWLMRRLRLFP